MPVKYDNNNNNKHFRVSYFFGRPSWVVENWENDEIVKKINEFDKDGGKSSRKRMAKKKVVEVIREETRNSGVDEEMVMDVWICGGRK